MAGLLLLLPDGEELREEEGGQIWNLPPTKIEGGGGNRRGIWDGGREGGGVRPRSLEKQLTKMDCQRAEKEEEGKTPRKGFSSTELSM